MCREIETTSSSQSRAHRSHFQRQCCQNHRGRLALRTIAKPHVAIALDQLQRDDASSLFRQRNAVEQRINVGLRDCPTVSQ